MIKIDNDEDRTWPPLDTPLLAFNERENGKIDVCFAKITKIEITTIKSKDGDQRKVNFVGELIDHTQKELKGTAIGWLPFAREKKAEDFFVPLIERCTEEELDTIFEALMFELSGQSMFNAAVCSFVKEWVKREIEFIKQNGGQKLSITSPLELLEPLRELESLSKKFVGIYKT